MGRFFFSIVLLFFIGGCRNDNGTILKEYLSAHNSHDVEKSLSFYSDDIVFELKGTWIKSGKEEIRELEEWDLALNSKLSFEVIKINNDTLFCTGTEQNDWFKAVGIDKLNYEIITFIFNKSLIQKVIAKPTDEVNAKIGTAMNSVIHFANELDENILTDLIPNGEFIYSKEAAEKWLVLLEKWNKSKI